MGRQTPMASIGSYFLPTYIVVVSLKILRLPSGDTETPPK